MTKFCYNHFAILIVTLLIGFANSVSAIADNESSSTIAGQVIFAVGDAYVLSPNGPEKAMVGTVVLAGDRLITGVNGYVHIRMADGAFLGLRSNSELVINEYIFNVTMPQNSRVRLFLKEGTVRAVSGGVAHANKLNFRLNTPLAAIGVRGTDFVTAANQLSTQVSVSSGGVAMAVYSEQCVVVQLGPCLGENVSDLYSQQINSLLVVKRGQVTAQLVSKDVKSLISSPHPQEQIDSGLIKSNVDEANSIGGPSHTLTYVLQQKLTRQEIKALNLLPSFKVENLIKMDTLKLTYLPNAVGTQQAYLHQLDRKVINIADRLFNTISQSPPLLRFYDQSSMLAWSATKDAALFDERLKVMEKDQTYLAFMKHVGLDKYLQGTGMEAVAVYTALDAWNTYYSRTPQEPIVQLGSSNLYYAAGLSPLQVLDLNLLYPKLNVAYHSVDTRVLSGNDGVVIDDVAFKINYENKVFEIKVTLNDALNGLQEYVFAGSLNTSGMIFGGNKRTSLEGLVINASGQVSTIFHYQNDGNSIDALVLFDDPQVVWPDRQLVAEPALFETNEDVAVNWGRWEDYAPLDDQVIDRLRLGHLELVANNSHFALFQPVSATHAMPIGDSFNFDLGSYEALHVAEGGTTTATLTEAKLNVDFSTAEFTTQMEVMAPRLSAPIHFFAKGEVGSLGQLVSSAQDSNINVAGMVADNASGVGMLLEHNLNSKSSIVAAMEWVSK